jgi:trigger factor
VRFRAPSVKNTKDLFEDAHQLMDVMKVGHHDVHDLLM